MEVEHAFALFLFRRRFNRTLEQYLIFIGAIDASF
ncbi:hypothetical protein TcasGA2_TC033438 [Tribolium castaneum]|uniref:Uncharacterized protein n=1 Tax=Tribolium castaneum TaxID=7070 RepID=A0A139WFZ4_TRICA|nr:hypothetical protein TcasGA2_TC033438 [Tribolium castaneum]